MDDQDIIEEPQIIEGEVTEEASVPTSFTPTGDNQGELVVNLGNLINANLKELENIEVQMNQQKEMIDNVLQNDATYKQHEEQAKEATRIKSNTKKEIFKRSDVSHVVAKLTELKENIRDTKEELSQYLQEYARISEQNHFESEDGTIHEIVYTAHLRKKSA